MGKFPLLSNDNNLKTARKLFFMKINFNFKFIRFSSKVDNPWQLLFDSLWSFVFWGSFNRFIYNFHVLDCREICLRGNDDLSMGWFLNDAIISPTNCHFFDELMTFKSIQNFPLKLEHSTEIASASYCSPTSWRLSFTYPSSWKHDNVCMEIKC
jgi:hypothetical protein